MLAHRALFNLLLRCALLAVALAGASCGGGGLAVPQAAPRTGAVEPELVIHEIGDYECGFCADVEPSVQRLLKEYGGRVQLVWRDYPLPRHPQAMLAAEAAHEVRAQGGDEKFWRYHRLLFLNQNHLSRVWLERNAEALGGIDMDRFRHALSDHVHRAAIDGDMHVLDEKLGDKFGTPAFVIGARLIVGAKPYDELKAAVVQAL